MHLPSTIKAIGVNGDLEDPATSIPILPRDSNVELVFHHAPESAILSSFSKLEVYKHVKFVILFSSTPATWMVDRWFFSFVLFHRELTRYFRSSRGRSRKGRSYKCLEETLLETFKRRLSSFASTSGMMLVQLIPGDAFSHIMSFLLPFPVVVTLLSMMNEGNRDTA